MTEPDIADAFNVSPEMQRFIGELAEAFCNSEPDPDAELRLLAEQMVRDCPEHAVELLIAEMIFSGRHSAATVAPASRTLH